MPHARDVLVLLRPANGLMAALAVLVGAAVPHPLWGAGGADFPWLRAAWAMLAAFFVAAFGNVLDDIFDRNIDSSAHPRRPLPAGRISLRAAVRIALFLLLAGFVAAFLTETKALLLFAAANALLLGLYARWLKSVPVLGNAVVALLVASTFLFGALLTRGPLPATAWASLWGFALMAFLANFARENAKSLEDAPHDSDRLTLAQLSPTAAVMAAWTSIAAAVTLAALMVWWPHVAWWLERPSTWDGMRWGTLSYDPLLEPWRLAVAASIPVFLAGALQLRRKAWLSQRILKTAMAVALAGYASGALLAVQAN